MQSALIIAVVCAAWACLILSYRCLILSRRIAILLQVIEKLRSICDKQHTAGMSAVIIAEQLIQNLHPKKKPEAEA
jgi:hypothetical protein